MATAEKRKKKVAEHKVQKVYICAGCEAEIPQERVEALGGSCERCVKCQTELEKRRQGRR